MLACIGREGEEMCKERLERNENVNTELRKASSEGIVSSHSGFETNSLLDMTKLFLQQT